MNRSRFVFLIMTFLFQLTAHADWSRGFEVPPGGRANPERVPDQDLTIMIRHGRLHALNYPVTVTGLLLPLRPVERFLNATRVQSLIDVETWLGLHSYPTDEGVGPYQIPRRDSTSDRHHMGFTVLDTPHGQGFTVSCAQCHTANLFGRRVMGLTNRFPRANEFFVRGLRGAPMIPSSVFRTVTGATPGETLMFERSKSVMPFIGAVAPTQLGLDTSLAQVALSLARRAQDGWATMVPGAPVRDEPLGRFVADSKPAVWWNTRYKNRWLSDGSVVSGNPIITNLLWNEIGRGTDLRQLDEWIARNGSVIRELTTAVFSSEAPLWTDFFPAHQLDEAAARRGEAVFNQTCARCHGTYAKAWSLPEASRLSSAERLRTTLVTPIPRTFVANVGTDPARWQGMTSLAQLNDLELSRRNGVRIEPQQGYVPPPLVGIWARWPYFHNNSVPSLCAVLTRGEARPKSYWAREANDPNQDFDRRCNGYPEGRAAGTSAYYRYDTTRPGLGNRGHDEGIFLRDGQEILTADQKMDLIEYLKTL